MPAFDLQGLIGHLSAHQHMALAIVFTAAFLESIAVIGVVVPGSTAVFLAGALTGIGILRVEWVLGLSVLGAVLGDGISYWFGHRYHARIVTRWPFTRRPELLERAKAFFERHGAKSVFLARFVGPIRALVPLVAGISDMPARRFYMVNVMSALAWALAHVMPGMLFGISLQLAGAISARLVALLLILLILLWTVTKLVRIVFRTSRLYVEVARHYIVAWAKRHRGRRSRVVLALFDPAEPEANALLFLSVLLLGGAWLFLGVLEDVVSRDPLVQADYAIYQWLQSMRTSWADQAMVVITALGGARVTGVVVGVVLLWLLAHRQWRASVYWLAALGFAELSVRILKFTLGRERPASLYTGVEQFSFPSGHATISIVLYGFLAFLLARRQSTRLKIAIASVASSFIVLIAFSRLYLGAHWFSDVLAALALGLTWVALIAIAYTHHAGPEESAHGTLVIAVVSAIAVSGYWSMTHAYDADLARYRYAPRYQTMTLTEWQVRQWQSLPAHRSEIGGEVEEPFTVQWVGSADAISRAMGSATWRPASPWSVRTALLWLLPAPPIGELPSVPKFNSGLPPRLTFVRTASPDERHVLRLWQSEYVVRDDKREVPAWFGMVTREVLDHPLRLVTVAKTTPDWIAAQSVLRRDLRAAGTPAQAVSQGSRSVLQIVSPE
jgi:undecaprenyl-diphosphatase